MLGMATLTIVMSSSVMKSPRTRTASAARGRCPRVAPVETDGVGFTATNLLLVGEAAEVDPAILWAGRPWRRGIARARVIGGPASCSSRGRRLLSLPHEPEGGRGQYGEAAEPDRRTPAVPAHRVLAHLE